MFVIMMTPAETLGVYTGFEIAAMLRGGLAVIPGLLVLYGIYRLATQGEGTLMANKVAIGKYVFLCMLLLGALWPESIGIRPAPIAATHVVSGIAQQGGGTFQNAAQMNARSVQTPTPIMMRMLVESIASTTWTMGQQIALKARNPSANVMPLKWALSLEPSMQVYNETQVWATSCVRKAQTELDSQGRSLSYEQSIPFGNTEMRRILGTMTVRIQRYLALLSGPPENCGRVGDALLRDMTREIEQTKTPGGAPLPDVLRDPLGMTAQDLAQLKLQSIVEHQIGVYGATPPHLLGSVGILSGAQAALGALGGFVTGGVRGALAGAAKSVSGMIAQVQRLLVLPMMVLHFLPFILAALQAVLIALSPLMLCMALLPGQNFRPVFLWLAHLIILFSAPIAYGLVELLSDVFVNTTPNPALSPASWFYLEGLKILFKALTLVIITIVGLLLGGITGVTMLMPFRGGQ